MAEREHVIPISLKPVHDFLNSADRTDSPSALGAWLLNSGLLSKPARVSQVEYQLALELRAGLRELALANNGYEPEPHLVAELRWLLRQFPLTVQPLTAAENMLAPNESRPVMAAFGHIVTGYALAVATGEWQRLRRCPAEDCGKVFWDSSAKAARRWCDMRTCGNRAKARAFAERRRT